VRRCGTWSIGGATSTRTSKDGCIAAADVVLRQTRAGKTKHRSPQLLLLLPSINCRRSKCPSGNVFDKNSHVIGFGPKRHRRRETEQLVRTPNLADTLCTSRSKTDGDGGHFRVVFLSDRPSVYNVAYGLCFWKPLHYEPLVTKRRWMFQRSCIQSCSSLSTSALGRDYAKFFG